MYEEFYGLSEKPFNPTPDPRYLYMGSYHREANDFLSACLKKNRADITVLTGEIGSGKTILMRSFLKDLGPSYELIQVFYPTSDCLQLLQMVLLNMGVKSIKGDLPELHDELKKRLVERHRLNKRLILVIDEAQHLGDDAIKETFRLAGIKDNNQRILKIVLSGLPKLRDKVPALYNSYLENAAAEKEHKAPTPEDNDPHGDAAVYQELQDKVSLLRNRDAGPVKEDDAAPQLEISSYHLKSLSAEDVPRYIRYRLKVAGCPDREIFSEALISEIGRCSGGTPRLIDMICDSALVNGYMAKEKTISLSTLQEVINRQFRDLLTQEGAVTEMPSAAAAAADENRETGVEAAKERPEDKPPAMQEDTGSHKTGVEQPGARPLRVVSHSQPELKVLILEKNARIKVYLENSFHKYGYSSIAVNSIEELIETLEHSGDREFHILVLDASFFFTAGGREDEIGKSALDRVKTTYNYLPLIMTSALPLSTMRAKLFEMGVPYLLQKPDVSRVDMSVITTQFNNFFEELRCCIDSISSRFSAFYHRFIKLNYESADKAS